MSPTGTAVRVKYNVAEISQLASGGAVAILKPLNDTTGGSGLTAPNFVPTEIRMPLNTPEALATFTLGHACWGEFTPAG
jgi:hypothetical protein